VIIFVNKIIRNKSEFTAFDYGVPIFIEFFLFQRAKLNVAATFCPFKNH